MHGGALQHGLGGCIFPASADENPEFTFFASRQIQADTPELLDGTGIAVHVTGRASAQADKTV